MSNVCYCRGKALYNIASVELLTCRKRITKPIHIRKITLQHEIKSIKTHPISLFDRQYSPCLPLSLPTPYFFSLRHLKGVVHTENCFGRSLTFTSDDSHPPAKSEIQKSTTLNFNHLKEDSTIDKRGEGGLGNVTQNEVLIQPCHMQKGNFGREVLGLQRCKLVGVWFCEIVVGM